MPGPDTVAEEAPVLIYLYLGMMAFLAWAFYRAAHFGWKFTIGAVLVGLGNLLNYDKWIVHIHWGDFFLDLNNKVQNFIVREALEREEDIGHFFHEAARLQLWIVDEIWKGTRDFLLQQAWLVDHLIPLYLRLYTAALHALERRLGIRVGHVEAQSATTSRVVTIPHAGELGWIHRHWKALTAAVLGASAVALPSPWAFPKFRHAWADIEKWRKVTGMRLTRLEKLLAASGLALAVATMTGTSLRCWRGQGNIARALRHVCGVPRWLLDILILGTVEAFVVADLCRFTDLLIVEAERLKPALLKLVDVEDALVGCHGTVKPIDFDLSPLSLPPMPGASPLAA